MRVWLLALIVLAAPATAAAQLGFVFRDAVTGELQCAETSFESCTVGGAPCTEAGDVCHEMSDGSGRCAAADVLWCDPFGSATPVCPPGQTYRRLFDLDVCAPPIPCGTDAAYCLTPPGSTGGIVEPVGYDFGDCDRDGLRNGTDPHPCFRAPPIGLVDPGSGECQLSVSRPCASAADCPAELPICYDSPDPSAHDYCTASESSAFCCGGMRNAVCVNGVECMPEGLDGVDLCIPFCRDHGWTYEMRLGCLRDPEDSSRFVRPGAGDCDGDGVVNGEEARSETRDPCVAEDGGVPMPLDAAASQDAGPVAPPDAGTTEMDASSATPPVQPTFEGGGGCRCRASASASSGAPWWLAFAALALWRRRRHSA